MISNSLPLLIYPFKFWLVICRQTMVVALRNNRIKEEIHTRILRNLEEREKYSLQNSAKIIKIG